MHLAYCICRCFQALPGVLKVLMSSTFFDASVDDTLGTKNCIGLSFGMSQFHLNPEVRRFEFAKARNVGLEFSSDILNELPYLCVDLNLGGRMES